MSAIKFYAYIEDGVVTNIMYAEPSSVIDKDPKYVEIDGTNGEAKIGSLYQDGSFVDPPKDQDINWIRIREERDRLLAECDWVVVKAKETGSNVPAAWKSYRQALRDITSTFDSANDVVFPEKP